MKTIEAIMEILAAYDLTGSYRDAAALAGCSHHTVAHYVRPLHLSQCGHPPVSRRRVSSGCRAIVSDPRGHGRHAPVRLGERDMYILRCAG